MIQKFIANRILAQLPFEPNEGQKTAIDQLCQFLTSRNERPCFILRGYAGTGKTSLVGALVRALGGIDIPCVLLAPTGRAAKVMSRYSGFPAYTIHRAIYRSLSPSLPQGEGARFTLAPNMLKHAVFIIDEASMLSAERDNMLFGSGCLLDDLVSHVYNGYGCRMILVGDDAQLPPVGHTTSPALQADYMAGYGLDTHEMTLTTVARQAAESGILSNATRIRNGNNQLCFTPDFIQLAPQDVMQRLEDSYREVGEEETLILTRSNFRTNLFNQGVRGRILYREELLEAGDRIMVTRNSYANENANEDKEFIANGEMFKIRRLRNEREIYGYHFVDAELISVDREFEITRVLWLDTLTTDTPEQNFELQRELYSRIAEDYPEIRNKRELNKKIMASPYYNALQIRYAYAVTGHKAQGGQWKHVYIDVPLEEREDHQRWIYTAITRATERIFWINSAENKE